MRRLRRITPGEPEEPADDNDNDEKEYNQRTRHAGTLMKLWCDKARGLLPDGQPRCIAPAAMLQNRLTKPRWSGKPIVLVGLMGVGKSTVGRRLATRLGLPFADADAEIETAAGMTVTEIFDSFGEPYFRDGERRVIARLLDGAPKVIATGGGAFINDETRSLILETALAIWLDAAPEVLVERVQRRDTRPLLRNRDPARVLSELAQIRNPIYAQAPIHVSSNNAPHDVTVKAILEALAR